MKIDCYRILVAIFLLVVLELLGVRLIDPKTLERPVKYTSLKPEQKVWFISYADGDSIHTMNQNTLIDSAVNKGFDIIIKYGKGDIDEKFLEENKETLSTTKGAGYWLWKPYFIRKTMDLMNDNDILVYVDSGAIIKKPLYDMIDKTNSVDFIVISDIDRNDEYTKAETYRILDIDTEFAKQQMQVQAGFVVLKKTQASCHIVDEWLKYCSVPSAINKIRSTKESPNFIAHRNDQSILSLLLLKPEFKEHVAIMDNSITEKYFNLHRRRSIFYPINLIPNF